jgi:glyoxylase-like metal-dependent hydrolase (beta-lactamase superfamily II)
LAGGSYQTLLKSIKDKLMTLSPETVVYCGHGPATTIGAEAQTNPFITGLDP